MAIPSEVPTSFVPHPPQAHSPKRPGRFDFSGALSFAAIIFFAVAVLVAGGLFIYGQYLNNKLSQQEKALGAAQKSLSQGDIARFVFLNTRISQAKSLLQSHRTPSRLFDLLEAKTVKNIQITSLNLTADNKSGGAKLKMTGVARDFSALVTESRALTQDSALSSVTFSNIGPDTHVPNAISFSVSALVPSSLVQNFSAIVAPEVSSSPSSTATSSAAVSSPATSTTP